MTQDVDWLEFSIYPSKIKTGEKLFAKGKLKSMLQMSVKLELKYEKPTPPIPHAPTEIMPTVDKATWIQTFDQVAFIPNSFYPPGMYNVLASFATVPWPNPPSFEIVETK